MAVALFRQIRTPGVFISTWFALLVLAAFAVQVDLGATLALVEMLPGSAGAMDRTSELDEILHATESGLGLGTASATLLTVVLFSLAGAASALVSAGKKRCSIHALSEAASKVPRLLAATFCGVAWLALVSLAGRALLLPAASQIASRWGVSEWRCLVVAEIASLALLAPGILAADLARVRIMLVDVPGYVAPFLGALRRLAASLTPWIALVAALALEALLLDWLAPRQYHMWHGREGPQSLLGVLPAIFVLARVLIYAAYLGGLASTIETEKET